MARDLETHQLTLLSQDVWALIVMVNDFFALGHHDFSHLFPRWMSKKFPAGPGEVTENYYLSRLPPAAGGTPQTPTD